MSNMNFSKNDEGVSPIIATLVLIVVAIIGAAAIGLIVGAFSSNVSQQASAGNTANTASTTITVAGSTSMQPIITELAQWYNNNNTGVKVSVVGGGSGAGYVSVGQGIADIGDISEAPVAAELQTYPNLHAYQVGASAVTFDVGGLTPITMTKADLQTAYGTGVCAADGITHVYDRSDASGTQDTMMSYLGNPALTGVIGESGNSGVLGALKTGGSAAYLGILDSDYAFGQTGISPVAITDGGVTYQATPGTSGTIISEIEHNNGAYPAGLVRPLNMITNGPATSIDQAFIQYVQSPNFQTVFTAGNQVSVTQVAPAFL